MSPPEHATACGQAGADPTVTEDSSKSGDRDTAGYARGMRFRYAHVGCYAMGNGKQKAIIDKHASPQPGMTRHVSSAAACGKGSRWRLMLQNKIAIYFV